MSARRSPLRWRGTQRDFARIEIDARTGVGVRHGRSLARFATTGAAWSAESVREVVDRLVVV